MTDTTDSKERGSIISSSDILLHDAKTALMYEELRAAIDDGHESMTHADALAEIAAIRAENEQLQAQLASIGAGGVSGPLMGQPQEMPDLSALTERGAKAWAGVDAQGLREGFTAADMATASAQGFRDGAASLAASAGSEPVATVFTMEALAPGGGVKYHATVHKPLPAGTKLYLHPSPPEGMVGGWIASQDQMPPPGVRVFWGDVDSHRVGYDSWAGDDYRWAPSHWMHIPEFPTPTTSSADSRKGE